MVTSGERDLPTCECRRGTASACSYRPLRCSTGACATETSGTRRRRQSAGVEAPRRADGGRRPARRARGRPDRADGGDDDAHGAVRPDERQARCRIAGGRSRCARSRRRRNGHRVGPVSVDPRIADWTGRIDGKVKAEVIRMHHHRSAWDRVSAMLSDNADLPHSYWWEFMFETYAITQASAVRRQADNRKDVDSLMRVIMDVRKGAAALTRTW